MSRLLLVLALCSAPWLTRAAEAVPATAAAPLRAAPGIAPPQTPAGRQFADWLRVFDSDDAQAYRDFITARSPALVQYIDDDLRFAALTGGFRLERIGDGDAHSLTGLLSEPYADVLTRFTIKVEASPPHRILALDLGPAERPADMPLPTLDDAALVAALQQRLDTMAAAQRFSGVVLLARGKRVLFERAVGFADTAAGRRNTPDTRFGLASMNKMFTAVAVLQLVDAGKLDLGSPLATWLPDYPNAAIAQHVTLHHLLTHTGGTGDIFVPEVEAKRDTLHSLADYVAVLGARAPQFAPGEKWEYSNYGFILLGRVIEKASGETYFDYIRKHVYAPAGMRHSGMPALADEVWPAALGYRRSRDGNGWELVGDILPTHATSAGGDLSTARDVLAFALSLQRGALLDAAAVERLTRGKVQAPFGFYAYGFKDQKRNGRRYIGHGGGAPGSNNELAIYPGKDGGDSVVAIVLTNQDPPAGNRVAEFIGNRVSGTSTD